MEFITLLVNDSGFRDYFFSFQPEYYYRDCPIEFAIDREYCGILRHRTDILPDHLLYAIKIGSLNVVKCICARGISHQKCQESALEAEMFDILGFLYSGQIGDSAGVEARFVREINRDNWEMADKMYDCGIRAADVRHYVHDLTGLKWLNARFHQLYDNEFAMAALTGNREILRWICDEHSEQINQANIEEILHCCDCGEVCRERAQRGVESLKWVADNYPQCSKFLTK